MEKWKPVVGFENYYEVSDLGRVKRKKTLVRTAIKHNDYVTVKERILKPHTKSNGYMTVDLSMGNIVKTVSVHRLVATAFCEKPQTDEKLEVNHINCNKADNRAVNLEWVTSKENKAHAIENGLFHFRPRKLIRCKQLNITFDGSYKAAEYINEKYFGNAKQIKGMSSKIRSCATGKQKTAYGFTWEYI